MQLEGFKYLALGGGAMHGVMYAGALVAAANFRPEVWAAWFRSELVGMSGTSMGALMAVLLSVWDPWRVAEYIRSTPFSKIVSQVGRQRLSDMAAVGGLCNGVELETLLQDGVRDLVGDAGCTLRQLRERTGKRVVVVVANMHTCQPEYWGDGFQCGDVPVWQALRASVSLPGLFPPVVVGGTPYCDGGLACNIPCYLWPAPYTLTLYVATGSRRAETALDDGLGLIQKIWDTLTSNAQLGPMRGNPAYWEGAIPCIPLSRKQAGTPSIYDFAAPEAGVVSLLAQGALAWVNAYVIRCLLRRQRRRVPPRPSAPEPSALTTKAE